MNRHTQAMWLQLQKQGVVDGEMPQENHERSPWYIKALLGLSGWFAAIFLMVFVGISLEFIMNDRIASFVTGTIMIAVAYIVLRIPKNEFIEHLALAISLAGQGWVIFSLADFMNDNAAHVWLLLGLMELALALVMPNLLHRVFSSFAAALMFSVVMIYWDIPYLFSSVIMFATAWIWLNEFNYPQHLQKTQAISYGLVLALIPIKCTTLFAQEILQWRYRTTDTLPWIQPWMDEVLTGLVTLFVVYTLLQRYGDQIPKNIALFILGGTLVLCLASLEAHGITVGMTIVVLGFASSNRVMMGLGITSLLFYISAYYYRLDTSLLNKSFSLLITGIVLLALHWLIKNTLIKAPAMANTPEATPSSQEQNHD